MHLKYEPASEPLHISRTQNRPAAGPAGSQPGPLPPRGGQWIWLGWGEIEAREGEARERGERERGAREREREREMRLRALGTPRPPHTLGYIVACDQVAVRQWTQPGPLLPTFTASERSGITLEGFQGSCLQTEARIWPGMSYLCHIRSTVVGWAGSNNMTCHEPEPSHTLLRVEFLAVLFRDAAGCSLRWLSNANSICLRFVSSG